MIETIYSLTKDLITYFKNKKQEPFTIKVDEEVITFEVKMRSLQMDVVKINAHDHMIGIRSEYAWVNRMYPGCQSNEQTLKEYEVETVDGNKQIINFDILHIILSDGRRKSVYFEIDSFFAHGKPSSFEPGYADQKILDLYSNI